MLNSSSPQFDLTGKLIIKVALGDDIRRIPIHNEDITYDELVLMMQRVYRGKLSTNDDITIKYKDEDGDLITIFDSSDLTFAIQCSRILKITLFVDGAKSLLEPSDTASIRRDLQDIRDRVIGLLDRLEPSPLIGATQALCIADGIAGKSDTSRQTTLPVSTEPKLINAGGGKEFDPLKSQVSTKDGTQNKVMSSFGINGNAPSAPSQTQYDRAATPDSISSIGSSASNQVHSQQNAQQPPPPQQNPLQMQQQPPQQQPGMPFPGQGQAGYSPNQPGGQMPQNFGGQPGYGGSLPGQQNLPQQQQPSAPSQQQQVPQTSQPSQQYDTAMYNQYNTQGYAGQPGQGQMTYGQPGGLPNAYGQSSGMPQSQQPKAPGYPPAPSGPPSAQSPGNPYSRGGPSYGAGYPRPATGYPQ